MAAEDGLEDDSYSLFSQPEKSEKGHASSALSAGRQVAGRTLVHEPIKVSASHELQER